MTTSETTQLVGLADVEAAARRVQGRVRHTPIVPTPFGTSHQPLLLKAECLQVTGSFKARGATNAIALLSADERARGVVTHSSGNHAQALARAAREAGVEATIVMPRVTPDVKVRATRQHGARIEFVELSQRESRVAEIVDQTGAVYISPFDNADIIAGQGTAGLEIAADVGEISSVWVPVSGGGLISGIAVAIKALSPRTRIVAVEPELAGDLADGFARGERASWSTDLTGRTIADGLRVPHVGDRNWEHIRVLVDEVVTVSEEQILAAMRMIVLDAHLVCEPSGAVAVAGFLAHGTQAAASTVGPAVAVVSGGNVDPALLARVVADRPDQGGVQ